MNKYHQNILIDHLNEYLSLNNRDMELDYGYCHGFSLLWLHCMSTNKSDWFYKTIHQLALCETESDYQKISQNIEKLLSHIEWLQNSKHYVYQINQLDIDQLLESPVSLSLSFLFNETLLAETFTKLMQSSEMMTISGPTHTIAAFKQDHQIYLFDPNYDEGYAKSFSEVKPFAAEVLDCLIFSDNKSKLVPLQINIIGSQHSALDKKSIYNDLLNQTQDLNVLGLKGLTNLFVACESGDLTAAKQLLRLGADPNIYKKGNLSPLHIAANSGYQPIVELLLKYKADTSAKAYKDLKPIHYAVRSGHLSCVKTLLSYQDQMDNKSENLSLLHIAMSNEHWPIVCYLLLAFKIKSANVLSKADIDFLIQHKEDLQFAAHSMKNQISTLQTSILLNTIETFKPEHTPFQFFTKAPQHCRQHLKRPIQYAIESMR